MGSLPNRVRKVDIEEQRELALHHQVMQIPMLVLEDGSRYLGIQDINNKLEEMRSNES